jgi:hypothetical protein
MATNNKSLTTYLPDRSVEWLESYCLEYKHLQNKDGNPKLGTAIADIIARLADGELTLPDKIEPQGNVPIQYGTELETIKGEVDELKKLLTEYGTSKSPDTVLGLKAVRNELLELIPSGTPTLETIKAEINSSIAPIENSISELETYTQSQFAAVRDEVNSQSKPD